MPVLPIEKVPEDGHAPGRYVPDRSLDHSRADPPEAKRSHARCNTFAAGYLKRDSHVRGILFLHTRNVLLLQHCNFIDNFRRNYFKDSTLSKLT